MVASESMGNLTKFSAAEEPIYELGLVVGHRHVVQLLVEGRVIGTVATAPDPEWAERIAAALEAAESARSERGQAELRLVMEDFSATP